MSKNVLLLESISKEADELLRDHTQVFEVDSPFSGGTIAKQQAIHAIITRGKGDASQELISLCPDLKVIARCGVGLDNVDVTFATQQGVKIVNAPGVNADTVAEHALALMLNLQRNLFNSFQAVKRNNWNFRQTYVGDEIRGKTLGIIGMGNIGKKVAQLASVFGMEIVYWGGSASEASYKSLTLDELLQRSDIISIHLPLTPDTRNLIDAKAFAKMANHALLINTARGEIIDQSALFHALQKEQLGGFAADVLAVEPPAENSPLLQLPNVLITPHSASLTVRTYNEMCVLTVQNVINLLSGKPIEDRYIFNRKELTT